MADEESETETYSDHKAYSQKSEITKNKKEKSPWLWCAEVHKTQKERYKVNRIYKVKKGKIIKKIEN